MSDTAAGVFTGPAEDDRATAPAIDTTVGLDALRGEARRASHLLKALSHETRLTVLCLLSVREMSVSEIERLVALPQATLSQQLARLRLEGLVATRREGRLIHYRLADERVHALVAALGAVLTLPVGDALERVARPRSDREIP